jgi:membrane protein DedA with SNARE-associated domain
MTSFFSAVVDYVAAHPHYALAAVFLLALSEAIPVIGTVVPGSTLIIGISALATGADVNPWLLLGAAFVGAVSGDGLSFWFGQRYHGEILLSWPLNRYPRFIERSENFINRYGPASVFLARFIAVVRAFVPLIAGILRCHRASSMRPIFCRHSPARRPMSSPACCLAWRSASPLSAQGSAHYSSSPG